MTLLEQTILIRAANPRLTFDVAWQQACSMQRVTASSFGRPKANSGDAVLVAVADGLKAASVKPPPAPPKAVEAARKPDMLIEGGFFNPLFPED
jgi:hypothetical protein